MSHRTLTIVFTDIKGFSSKTAKASREELLLVLTRHEEMLLPIIIRHQGRVIKTIGDAFMLSFESPTNAVRCGLVMQDCLHQYNATCEPADKIEIRVGINTGEVILLGSDIFGDTVNIASRVEGIAQAGDVYFTHATYLAMNKAEIPTSEVGEFHLKGIPEQVKVYKVSTTENTTLYRRVIDDQERLKQEFLKEEIPVGTFSKNLLYSHERAPYLADNRHDNGRWVFAAAFLLVLSLPAMYSVRQLYQQNQMQQAANELRINNPTAAFVILSDLRRKRPSDPRVSQLLGYAVVMDVQRLLHEQQFEKALTKIQTHQSNFPYLPIYEAIERNTRIRQTQFKTTTDSDAPGESFPLLLQRYPGDLEIRERMAASLSTIGEDKQAMYVYLDLIEKHPEYSSKPVIRQHLEQCLAKYVDQRLQLVVANHLIDHLGESLAGHIYSTDSQILRRNSFAILQLVGADIDPVAFYTVELLTSLPADREALNQTLSFFEREVIQGATPTLVASAPIVGNEIPVLRIFEGPYSDRILAVINALFAERLRPLLQQFVSDQAKRGHRLNAYRILLAHEWLNDELTLAFHLANIADHDRGEARSYELFSVKWLATEGPFDRGDLIRPLLEANKKDLEDTIKRWTKAGNQDQLGTRQELLKFTNTALRRVGN